MPNLNNEGFAITPQRECVDGSKPVFWSDDNNTDLHALRSGTLNCTVIVDPQTITFAQPARDPVRQRPGRARRDLHERPAGEFRRLRSVLGDGYRGRADADRLGRGIVRVTATQPGNAFFHPAPPVMRTVAITKAPTGLTQTPVSFLGALFSFRITYPRS